MAVRIVIHGCEYRVPEGLTALTAMEYCGYELTHGCGCRGGFCGACGMLYRVQGDFRLRSGLACQTRVEDGMEVVQFPAVPVHRARVPEGVADLKLGLLAAYPEVARCLGCGTCMKACPQELEPMEYVQAALRGDFARAAELSFDCIMCGLCALRCPAEISPQQVGLFVRRLYVRAQLGKPAYLLDRVGAIKDGRYDAELERLREMPEAELRKIYEARDFEPI